MHVKKGDKVVVISGKDKGKEGTILEAYPKKNVFWLKASIMLKTRTAFSR